MKIKLYQIDAFASKAFEGNPAAVCPLKDWIPDNIMQAIAMENNLSETAFFVKNADNYHIRWFTPVHEVDLCGHATLASAHLIFTHLEPEKEKIVFESRSGILAVERKADWLEMDFPAQIPVECEIPPKLTQVFGIKPLACFKSEDYIVIFEHEEQIINARPNLSLLQELDLRGVAIAAKSDSYDFVTRFFAPKLGINEDPVTGSAFTQLIPYWANRLNKTHLIAKQISQRGGEVKGVFAGERVKIAGKAVIVLIGEMEF